MYSGTRSLTRTTAAWLAGLAFALVYLLSYWVGASWQTSVTRGAISAALAWFIAKPLLHPLFDTLLSALTEAERAKREAEE